MYFVERVKHEEGLRAFEEKAERNGLPRALLFTAKLRQGKLSARPSITASGEFLLAKRFACLLASKEITEHKNALFKEPQLSKLLVFNQNSKRLAFGMALLIFLAIAASSHVAGAFSRRALLPKDGAGCPDRGRPLRSHRRDLSPSPERVARRRRHLEHWGVERQLAPPAFPSSFGAVADEACRAIAGTLSGLQRPDPNVASNAMHRSVLDYRPTHPKWMSERRWRDGDDGATAPDEAEENVPARMGIELDGAAYLSGEGEGGDEGRAMRVLSLRIAQRLSAAEPYRRGSVSVYFNSVEQSLLASRELSRMREGVAGSESPERIAICCLGQDFSPPGTAKKGRGNRTSGDGSNVSIVLIVKPSDCSFDSLTTVNGESRSPVAAGRQPTIQTNVVDKLQLLLFQASASSVPAVVLSPRLSELPPLQSMSTHKRTGPSGFEQSGYQQSSTYGGTEPPVGPTSWLLRDLSESSR